MAATKRQLQCAALLEAQGYSPSGASALVGNFSQESGINLAVAWRTKNLDHGSQGLAQWRLDRLTNYESFVHAKYPTADAETITAQYGRLDYQVEFVAVEMKKDYAMLDQRLRRGGDVSALTADVCWQYERPSKALSGIANRIAQAKVVYASTTVNGKAKPVNLAGALDIVADQQRSARTGGIALATASAGTMALGGLAHLAPSMHWWEWIVVVVLLLVAAVGVSAAIVAGKQVSTVTAATGNVDTSHVQTMVPAPAAPVAPAAQPANQRVAVVDPAKAARDAEREAIEKAMVKPTPAATTITAPAVVTSATIMPVKGA